MRFERRVLVRASRFLLKVQRRACCICGAPMDTARLERDRNPNAHTIEHVRPRCKGGKDTADNVRLSHARCNRNRGHRDVAWYPLPCFRPAHLPALHLVLATRMHSRFQWWADNHDS